MTHAPLPLLINASNPGATIPVKVKNGMENNLSKGGKRVRIFQRRYTLGETLEEKE